MVYADLNGWRVNGGTVPADLALTEQNPDMVIIDRSATPIKVVLLELTVPWDSSNSFQAALDRKTARYERLADELQRKGYTSGSTPHTTLFWRWAVGESSTPETRASSPTWLLWSASEDYRNCGGPSGELLSWGPTGSGWPGKARNGRLEN